MKNEIYSIENGEGSPQSVEYEEEAIREHIVGVTMSIENAFSVGCWILAETLGADVTQQEIYELVSEEYSGLEGE